MRGKLEQVGGAVAKALGFEKNTDGTYTKKGGSKEFGGDKRQTKKTRRTPRRRVG
jgi:hypothetical protein